MRIKKVSTSNKTFDYEKNTSRMTGQTDFLLQSLNHIGHEDIEQRVIWSRSIL